MNQHLRSIANSFSEIFFLNNPLTGGLILVVTLVNPNLGAAGIIAVLAAYLFARFLKVQQEFLYSGFYTYNALLVGLSVGYLFQMNLLTLFFVVILGILTFLVTSSLFRIFSLYLGLPILSLPFVIVSSVAYLSSSKYSSLYVNNLYPHVHDIGFDISLPFWIDGYFKSLGTILFLPETIAGMAFALIILLSSRILMLLSLMGYFAGTLVTGMMVGSFEQAFSNINHFNFILIAMAVGGIFLVPGPRTYLMALLAVITAPILLNSVDVFWSLYGIPAFTMPFILISLVFIYVLNMFGSPLIAQYIRSTPEETLDHYLTDVQRYHGSEKTLSLPFSGTWTVWQGFDGNWTHKDAWKYAYDFVITDNNNTTFKNNGETLEDYYAFGKPVLSPVRGRIVKVVGFLPDNAPGKVDEANNWGNYLIILDARNFYVEISHFAQNSIKVAEGDWVEKGHFLGLCGNSGYSPQPHIHIQVQATEVAGSNTLPFSFIGYLSDKSYHSNQLPEEKGKVTPLAQNNQLDSATTFLLDSFCEYEVFHRKISVEKVRWVVKMGNDGTFYFDSGKGKLFFGKRDGTFYCYRLEGKDPSLTALMQALPRMPLGHSNGIEWKDNLPVHSVLQKGKGELVLFLCSFFHSLGRVEGTYRFTDKKTVEGQIVSARWNVSQDTLLKIDGTSGFETIVAGDYELRKIHQ